MSLFACMVPFILDEFCAGILSNFSFFDRFDKVKQRLQTQDLAMIIQCSIITGLYTHAAWTMKRSRTTRWHSTTTSGHVAMLLHCASNVYELYLYGALGAFSKGDAIIVSDDAKTLSHVTGASSPAGAGRASRPFKAVAWRNPDGEYVSRRHVPSGMQQVAELLEGGRQCALTNGFVVENPSAKPMRYIIHHVLTIVVYEAALHMEQLHFFACWAGLCEVTNLFLQPHTMLTRTNMKQSWAYYLNGLLLWGSF